MYNQTRLRLTILYTLLLVTISSTISTALYFRTAQVIDDQFEVIENRLLQERARLFPRGMQEQQALQILPEDVENAKERIIVQLFAINGIIVIIFAAAGYYFSGRTLKPMQDAMEEQKRFVGDAAHELKTPITALKTALEVNLMDESHSENIKTLLNDNLRDVNNLQSLTESLLRLAKQDAGVLTFTSVKLTECIEDAIKHIQPLADARQISIEDEMSDAPLYVKGNYESLQHLVTIFLDNAIKYSPESTTIKVTAKSKGKTVQINFADQGIGIEKHHLPHIFDRFYRVDSSRNKSVFASGYGLGLSVAKKIIAQHHGSVSVTSEIDHGTTFTIVLPKSDK
ncbi:HAMP domain-containing histidine kinase [candidate division WWE3 bacterium]|uniref:histidine kinase n=1 Tax=candidate division WWE3 bacterium TaxID=2053526 RepID=A0A955RQI3_UNCKA|nr:HAMP domain-containing histidine kinase [candidate division WWE3 bacterium]